jgi:tetratricopeptide (TPR) repeat protein
MKAYQKGRMEQAIQGFIEARQSYTQQGDQLKAAEMANNLSVALLQAGKPQEALEAVHGTTEVFSAHGDRLRAAQSLGNLGAALHACGDREGAEEALKRAAEMFADIGDKQARAETLKTLSQIQLGQGQPLQALASMQAGLEEGGAKGLGSRVLKRLLRFTSKLLTR